MKNKMVLGIVLVASLFFTACSSSTNTESSNGSSLSGVIIMDGSSTVFPLSEAVAEEFRAVASEVSVTIGSSGSGAGFKKFARGESDISNASRAIKQKEIDACVEGQIDYLELRVALDGLAIVVNKENDWLESITVEELKLIWEPGSKVTNWSDVREEWPNEPIDLFGPSTAHGTYDFFTEEVVGESGASRSDYNAVSDYNVAVQGIKNNKNALGYFGLAYFTENADQLKLVAVDNGSGAIYPSLETVGDGTYSPLARPLYLYVKTSSLERDEVKRFVDFYLESCPELTKAVGYIPLPDTDYKQMRETIAGPAAEEQ